MLCQDKSSLPSTHHLSFPCKANIYFASSVDFSIFCLKLTEGELNTISIQTYLLVSLSHNRFIHSNWSSYRQTLSRTSTRNPIKSFIVLVLTGLSINSFK